MRSVVQRVADARVEVGGRTVGAADRGILVYLGVAKGDGETDVAWMADKVANLRIFEDSEGKMNRSVIDSGGSALVISQFTLLADARKGRRPSYSAAAGPEEAKPLYESFVELLRSRLPRVETGLFQAEMRVSYVNEGPITILLDSRKSFGEAPVRADDI
jgi:D-aminoacyl-tRNA deacylase